MTLHPRMILPRPPAPGSLRRPPAALPPPPVPVLGRPPGSGPGPGRAATAGATAGGPRARPFPIDDHVGAWVPHGRWLRPGRGEGPLHGLRYAVQDLFDIAGQRCGAGLPERLHGQSPAPRDQALVQALQASGAELAGQLLGDPLGLDVQGTSPQHGAPRNPRAPERLSGGACSGPAAAVAAGLVHFALVRDCTGDIARSASHCGLWGLRATHDLLPLDGVVPLSASFDSAGWLAAEGCVLERVAATLLPDVTWRAWQTWRPRRLLCTPAIDAWADPVVQAPLQAARDRLLALLQLPQEAIVREPWTASASDLAAWGRAVDTIVAHESWRAHGGWLLGADPDLGEAAAAFTRQARSVDAAAVRASRGLAQELRTDLRTALAGDGVLLLPAAVSLAPRRDTSDERLERLRQRGLGLAALAACSGLPQITLPWPTGHDTPLSLSLIGPAGSDRALTRLARQLVPTEAGRAAPLR